MHNVFAFLNDESGGTAIEYGLVAAGVSAAVVVAVNSIGGTFNEKMVFISNKFGN